MGVETSGRISGADLGAGPSSRRAQYRHTSGVPPSRFRAAIAQWQSLPGTRSIEEYASVDLGCGKGLALLLASGMNFRECLGAEIDPGLSVMAQRNLDSWVAGGRALCPTRIVTADVVEAELPRTPALIYLYNPFRGAVLRRLLRRLESDPEDQAAGIDLIYLIPEQAAEFAVYPRFKRIWEGKLAASDKDIADEGIDRDDACQMYRR